MNISRPVNEGQCIAGTTAPVSPPLSAALNLCIHKTRGNIKRLADEPESAA